MAVAAALACVAFTAVPSAAEAETSATAVEATYLYKFAPFVTWPDAGTGPFTLCVVGDDPFGALLDRAVAGQAVNSGPIQVVRLDAIGRQSGCDVAYLGGSPHQGVDAALREVRGAPVLTVTDEDDPPGIVAFAIIDGHVRFRIDEVQAQANGLNVSSKLLGLAVSVRTPNGQVQP